MDGGEKCEEPLRECESSISWAFVASGTITDFIYSGCTLLFHTTAGLIDLCFSSELEFRATSPLVD